MTPKSAGLLHGKSRARGQQINKRIARIKSGKIHLLTGLLHGHFFRLSLGTIIVPNWSYSLDTSAESVVALLPRPDWVDTAGLAVVLRVHFCGGERGLKEVKLTNHPVIPKMKRYTYISLPPADDVLRSRVSDDSTWGSPSAPSSCANMVRLPSSPLPPEGPVKRTNIILIRFR